MSVSLTTKAWIDDGQDVTWLNDHDNQAGLGEVFRHVGTDPPVRVFDVDPRGPSTVVTERETLRLSELSEDDGRADGRPYARPVVERPPRARVEDVHELALGMPHVKVLHGPAGNPIYQVGGRSFVFFRTPRPDAFDPETGQRYPDVIMFWVPSESDKLALVQDDASPFFTTPHFDGHPSVLVRASRLGDLTRPELAEIVEDAWLSRASPTRGAAWLKARGPG